MEKAYLKTVYKHTHDIVDTDTGEVVDTSIKEHSYLANSREEFFLTYSSLMMILQGSADNQVRLLAYLIEKYSNGQEFSNTKDFRDIISERIDCSPRSLERSFKNLLSKGFIYKIKGTTYAINPRHVFKGSSSDRKKALKLVLEIHCPDC